MKRGYEVTYTPDFPLEIFGCIYPYLSDETKSAMSRTSKAIAAVCSQSVLSLHVSKEPLYLDWNIRYPNIQKIIIESISINAEALNSLAQCRWLETLALGGMQNPESAAIFLTKSWNLKRLAIHLKCEDFGFTKNMPHLEFLTLRGSSLSEEANMEELGINCKNLKELRMSPMQLNKTRLDKLTKQLSKLEVFIFRGPQKLQDTEETIKNNCPLLNLNHSEKSNRWSLLTFYSSLNNFPKQSLDLEVIK